MLNANPTPPGGTGFNQDFRERDVLRRLWAHADARTARDANGLDGYGCSSVARPTVLALGSCTASSPTARALQGALEDCARLDSKGIEAFAEQTRERLLEAWGIRKVGLECDVLFTPSGTDAELMIRWLCAAIAQGPIQIIMPGASERGSGTAIASDGRHFSTLLPDGNRAKQHAFVCSEEAQSSFVGISHRAIDGQLLPTSAVQQAVADARDVAVASGRSPVIHDVLHSKSGWSSTQHFDTIANTLCVIDAAQARTSPKTVQRALQAQRLVLVTGSKFWGGPPFCGALLVPNSWREAARRAALPAGLRAYFGKALFPPGWAAKLGARPEHGEGVLLRWSAGLREFESVAGVEPRVLTHTIESFESLVTQTLQSDERVSLLEEPRSVVDSDSALERCRTVFSFAFRTHATLSLASARRAVEQLHGESAGWHLGQPLALAENRVLFRIALGVPLLRSLVGQFVLSRTEGACMTGLSLRLPRLIDQLHLHVDSGSARTC